MSISGLVQVYDLVAPLDGVTAESYLQRLGSIAGALLANRDDIRGFPEDLFRGQVMPAWGAQAVDRDGKWNTDVVTSGRDWDVQPGQSEENIQHAQFELGSLAVILERQVQINALLARAGRPEQVPLSPAMFVRFANTFLRIVWRHNVLSNNSNGNGGDNYNYNRECAGWIPLAQFDPWVWTRSRDTTFSVNAPGSLRVDNHGALLRYRKFNSMKYLADFAGQNWLITPAALAVGQPQPKSIHDQKWLIVLSGVVLANLKGDDSGVWNSQTVSFMPDMAGPDDPSATSGPLNWAISQYSIPKPAGSPGTEYLIRFSVEGWAPSVSLNAIFDKDQSINAGFAVNAWRPNSFGSGTNVLANQTDVLANQTVNNLFAGINADLAVSDSDAWLYRLGYNITLLGKIVFIATGPPLGAPTRL
jgi:hypothetical protein